MRSWKKLCVVICIPFGVLQANNDTLTVQEKVDAELVKDAVWYLDSLNQRRNSELAAVFFNETSITNDVDTSFEISDAELIGRLETLNQNTPLELSYNKRIRSFIHLYAVRQKELTEKILGLSQYYFPIIEEALDKYDIPLEIKYLAVVESALNPSARSHAGASGMWQFMYWTAKANGLSINSYVDERLDPVKATEAACQYLLELHGMYDDWNLALAAYNSGPGNVNKAIRRSGGKKDYWGIWAYLPRETRSYVPAFIAVNYVMNFSAEHGLQSKKPLMNFWERDTVLVTGPLSFDDLSKQLNIPVDIIDALNPSFKKDIIPGNGRKYALVLPSDKILTYLDAKNDSAFMEPSDGTLNIVEEKDVRKLHYVRSGEVLGTIARKHRCSVRQIMEWNNLRNSRIRAGQRLVVYGKNIKSSPTLTTASAKKTAKVSSVKTSVEKSESLTSHEYYEVKSGDTLWDIANKYDGVSVSQLKQLNGSMNVYRLKPGQKLKIKVKS
jgi:membrane-bound lytic murein transglycosylase D